MPSTHDPIERLAAADPVPGAERLTADEQLEAEALLARLVAEPASAPAQRRRVRRWAPAVALACALAGALAAVTLLDDDAPGPSVVEKAVAAVSAENAVYHVIERVRFVDHPGQQTDPAPFPGYIESWYGSNGAVHQKYHKVRDGRKGRLMQETAGRLYPRSRGRFGGPMVVYDPRTNTFSRLRFGRVPNDRTPVIDSNRDPGADLRDLEREGRLRVAGTVRVGGKEAYRLVSGPLPGRPKGVVETYEYVVDAETYYPLSQRWIFRSHGNVVELVARYLVYERLPFNARTRKLLKLDPHPGATELNRNGRRVRD